MKAVCPHCQATITIAAPPVKSATQTTSSPSIAAPTVPGPASVAAKPMSVEPASVALKSPDVPRVEALPLKVLPNAAHSHAAQTLPPTGDSESTSPAQAVEGPPYARKRSKVPLVAAAVGMLIVVGVAALVWRPWLPNDRDSIDKTAAVTSRGDDANRTPVVTVPEAPANVAVPEAAPTSRDETADDDGDQTIAVPSEIASPQVVPTASRPNIAAPRPSPSVPIVTAPQPTPQPRATVSTPSQTAAGTSRLVYDKAPIPAGSEGAEAVTAQTTVRTGQRLHAEFQGKWYAVTVVEGLADGNVRVRWETWGRDIVGNVPRNRLRIPGSTPSAQTP
jgi:hypothetical protein